MSEMTPESPHPERSAALWSCGVVVVALMALGAFGYLKIRQIIGTSFAKNNSQKLCSEIASAASSFFADYEHLPPPAKIQATPDTEFLSDFSSDFVVVLAARGPLVMNPRRINYFDGMPAAQSVAGKLSGGINFGRGSAEILDSWGRPYRVVLDANYDGEIDNPELKGTGSVSPPPKLRGKKCVVYSAGPDGDYTTWDDNPKSW